jgi:hypothetical protein
MSTEESLPQPSSARNPARACLIALAAWIVPGLGHLLLRRWGRALGLFLTVVGLLLAGFVLRGEVFSPHSADPFGALGFLSDLGSGIFYFLAHFFEPSGANLSRASGDYGTRFIAAAGIVNVIGMLDAYGIARGQRR